MSVGTIWSCLIADKIKLLAERFRRHLFDSEDTYLMYQLLLLFLNMATPKKRTLKERNIRFD